jgi:hypothetical protein
MRLRTKRLLILIPCLAVAAGTYYLLLAYGGMPWTYQSRLARFYELRKDAESIAVGTEMLSVFSLLGTPDYQEPGVKHFPKQRIYYFDIHRQSSARRIPRSHIRVLADETGVRTVDVYDAIFETCTGNKIEGMCTPYNPKCHDRFAGPIVRAG